MNDIIITLEFPKSQNIRNSGNFLETKKLYTYSLTYNNNNLSQDNRAHEKKFWHFSQRKGLDKIYWAYIYSISNQLKIILNTYIGTLPHYITRRRDAKDWVSYN